MIAESAGCCEQLDMPSSSNKVYLSELMGALSYALDLTEGLPPGHCLRSCWIGMQVAIELHLDDEALSDVFFTILLKDAGCSSNAARIYELYDNDDLSVKADFCTVDNQSLTQVAKFVWSHLAPQAPIREKLSRLVHLAIKGNELQDEVVTARCERGASIAKRMGFNDRVAEAINSLNEHWNGKGRPNHLSGNSIPLHSRIALLAQVVEIFYSAGGPAYALKEVYRRNGTWFDPRMVAALNLAAGKPSFWSTLKSDKLERLVMSLEPASHAIEVDDEQIDIIAAAFAEVIDSKSPFTSGHSDRVAIFVDAIASELGLSTHRRRALRRIALLHDIGKLGVSNAILDKPGKLTDEEWASIKKHPVYSRNILERISIFSTLATVAGAHHERLDGKGYPDGINKTQISLETRIITTADVFDALTADRPYRKAMPLEQALAIMEKDRGSAIDSECLDALKRAIENTHGAILKSDDLQSH